MNTSYAAWARYDVDDALARVDLLEQQEQIERQKQQRVAAKRRVEDEVSQDAEQSAEAVAAHAAVAALKAKARSRGAAKTKPPTSGGDSAEALQRHAELLRRKHALIKATMDARRRGDALVEENGPVGEAKQAYEDAIASAKALEAIVPQLVELQRCTETSPETIPRGENQPHEDPKETSGETPDKCDGHDHKHEHAQCESCPPSERKKKVISDVLPKKDDLGAVVTMFLQDGYFGIGSCEMKASQYAAASEAFKEVLLRDENHLLAWLNRGRAFEAMDAPLLAWLHYNRVANTDPTFEDAKECEDRIKSTMTTRLVKETPDTTTPIAETLSLSDMLRHIKLEVDAANVIMIEGFFEYAITKYMKAIQLVFSVRQEYNPTGAQETIITKVEATCHVNIASCYLEMQKNFASALKHCELALDNDPGHIVANFRLAQVHRAMHAYEQALESYHTTRMLVAYLPPAEATKQLKKLDEDVDKCEFERSQYDTAYIRQQMRRESTT